jgi:LmbE family N-acetylglucosaminyl deacetylase
MRHLEAINAVKKLGLNESNIIFLGYPDAGLRSLLIDHWDSSNPYTPPKGSNQNDHSPYNFTYEKNAVYSGENVAKNIKQIMIDYKPTIIFYPDDGDDHPDHWATSAFVRYAAIDTNYTGQGYTYLVHKGVKWPSPMSYHPQFNLYFADEMSALTSEWFYSSMTSEEEKNKGDAINSHSTQIYMTKDLLQSFIRVNEIFASYPIIVVEKVQGIEDLEMTLPNSTYQDVKNDPQTQLLQEVEDLSSAGIAYDNNNLYLYLQTKTDIENSTNYNFHLNLYQNNQFKTVDINVKDGVATYFNNSVRTIQPSADPELIIDYDILILSLPPDLLDNTTYILMTVEIADDENNKVIDFMSWRVFKLPENMNFNNSTESNQTYRSIG